jgi:signal transduction histidine kinase
MARVERTAPRLFVLLLVTALGLFPLFAQATECVAGHSDLAPSTRVLEDVAGQLTPEQALHRPSVDWHAADVRTLQPGYSGSVWWLRIALRHAGQEACQGWLAAGPAHLRDVQVFVPRAAGGWTHMIAGASYPLRMWPVPQRQPVFPVTLAPEGTTTLLVRVSSPGTRMAFTPQLWAEQAFEHELVHESIVDGAVFGAMLVLVCFGVALGWVFRRRRLVYIALAVLCYTGYVALLYNYGYIHLWPGNIALNRWATRLAVGLTFFAGNLYFCDVTRVSRLGPGWSRTFAGFRVAYLALALGNLWVEPGLWLAILLGLDSVARVLFTVVVAIHLRHRSVGWYPPTLIALGWLEPAMRAAYLLGFHTFYTADNHLFSTTVLPGGIILIATLISQMAKARRNELRARAALERQQRTERARLEELVSLRTGQLQRALRTRSALLARIGHDLRAPLAGMVDAARQWHAGVGGRDFPRLIERNARQQMELIDELVEFSRDELADLEVIGAPGYLHGFLYDLAEQAQLLAERHDNRLQCRFAEDLPAVVVADFRRLRQVLMNLLGNAAKFTRGGRVLFEVRARFPAPDKVALAFTVEDNGIGIPMAERERLLQPFARGSNAAGHEGKGLGLTIVSQLLQLMGGTLHIDEVAGGGSRFDFELHLALAGEDAVEPGGDLPEATVDGAERTILVVDDQAQNRDLLCDLLAGSGFDPHPAAGGRDALAWLHDHEVALVLTDQCMDDMDGWSLLAEVRARRPGLPVLLYSALPPRRPVGTDPTLHFDACLLKPVDSSTLLECIGRLVAGAPPNPVEASASGGHDADAR